MTEAQEAKPIIDPAEEASEEEFRAAMKAAEAAASVAVDTPTEATGEPTALDSLQGNEFAVELDGAVLKGVFRVSGLTSFKLGADNPPITLAKMVQRDASLPFNQWIKETMAAAGGSAPTRTLDIVAIDDGEETRRWSLSGAYITEISYTDFDTSSSDFVEETVTIAYASLTESWTWSDSQ